MRELAEGGGACHGGNASLGAEPDFGEVAVVGYGGQFKDVAADGILLAHANRGLLKFAGVARVLEVIQKLGRVHVAILTRVRNSG